MNELIVQVIFGQLMIYQSIEGLNLQAEYSILGDVYLKLTMPMQTKNKNIETC